MNIQQPPPMPVARMTLEDESHLNLLSVFHYVVGGLCVLGIGFVILHFVMMSLFLNSLVVSGINCLQIPFGTVLGIFTIIVLMRPSVQSGYEANLSPQ